ncbi:hypothetical protein [Vulgatibacter sp.]|uniref:hypothetical protein n=1 Tax=Vulgatibacter sp. TaxID=1971226 RepID=UPI003563F7C8
MNAGLDAAAPTSNFAPRLLGFVALLLAVAAVEWLALAFSSWTWSVAAERLVAMEAGGSTF